jgi:hypothetical protein
MTAKTSEQLALTLEAHGFTDLARRARNDEFHDYLSNEPLPALDLVRELLSIGTRAALEIRMRVINGEFDASREESDEWAASPEGQEALGALINGGKTNG